MPDCAASVAEAVAAQFAALCCRWAIPAMPATSCFIALTDEALRGPFGCGPRRFSAINSDGVPFQWSVSVGSRPGGLRFLVDCGVPGATISARIAHTRSLFAQFAAAGALAYDRMGLDNALAYLLPEPRLLDASLMGLWVGGAVLNDGTLRLKVYVNERVGEALARYTRFGACLANHGRWDAVARLVALVRVVGERAFPVASAFDLAPSGVGRFKLYFRPVDGNLALLVAAAEAIGCATASARLDALRRTVGGRDAYPDGAVVFSAEFPEADHEADFKVDVNTAMTLAGDDEADRQVRELITAFGLPKDEYEGMRDIVVGPRGSRPPRQLLFVGVALRNRETRVNVYFHPSPLVETP